MEQKTELLILDINTIITGYYYEENKIVPIIDNSLNIHLINIETKFNIIVLGESSDQFTLRLSGIQTNNIKFIPLNETKQSTIEFLEKCAYNYSFYANSNKSNIFYIGSNQEIIDQVKNKDFDKSYLVTLENTLVNYLEILQYNSNTNPFAQSALTNTNKQRSLNTNPPVQQQDIQQQAPQESDGEIPSEFICPITQDIMNDPVILTSGIIYERKAIEEWFNKSNTCPITRQENVTIMGADSELKKRINIFKAKEKTNESIQTQSVMTNNSIAKQANRQPQQFIKTPQEDLERLENEYLASKNKKYADAGIFGRSPSQETDIKTLKNKYLKILEEALKNSYEVNDRENLAVFYLMAENSPLMKHNAGIIFDTFGFNPDSADKVQEMAKKYPIYPQKSFNNKD